MFRESIYKRYIPAVTPDHEGDTPILWFVFNSNRILVKLAETKVHLPCAKDLREFNIVPVRSQYLGMLDGHPCYSAEVTPDTKEPEGMSFKDLRPLFGAIDEDLFFLAGKASQVVSWDQTHQYCGKCGTPTEELAGERAKKCPKCGFISFPRISPAVITAVFKGDQILLAHNNSFPGNMYSLIAGFVEPGETLEECVKREIQEEVGVHVGNIKYFSSQPWPFPNSLMIGFTAEYESGEILVDGVEINDAGWFKVSSLPELPSKMSIARQIIDHYIREHSSEL